MIDIVLMPIYVWLAVFGLCIGSFMNVVVYRLPEGKFFSQSRSFCPACGTTLRWMDLLPVVSYVLLKGKCRYCGGRISVRYPLVEAFCGFLAVFCFMRFGFDWKTPLVFAVLMILVAVTLIDFDTMEIPDSLVIALIPLALAGIWCYRDISLLERIIGFFVISLPLTVITVIIKDAFGGGDIKLMAVCGFLLGWKFTLLAFVVSLILGGGVAVYLLISKKSRAGAHMAFGPYLCVGLALALFFGNEIISAYLSLFI